MDLVHKMRDPEGNEIPKWDVAWTWMPYFVATNPAITSHVLNEMSRRFVDRVVDPELVEEMNQAVVDLICEKMPMRGLRNHLNTLRMMVPEEKE